MSDSQRDQPFHPVILRFDSLPSTNTEAARQALSGAPEGLCIVARGQTAGRGRHDRTWISPAGAGLYFSLVLRPRFEMNRWPLITLMAAVAVSDALHEACALQIDIKWPNDIHAQKRKLCGILAETTEMRAGQRTAVILGIGINLKQNAFPAHLKDAATSIEDLTSTPVDPETLLRILVRALASRYASLCGPDGPRVIINEWSRRSSYAEGRRVRVRLDAEIFDGTTRGLETDGALRVETPAGEIRIVRAGDVTALRRIESE